jgi:hypothetical protein
MASAGAAAANREEKSFEFTSENGLAACSTWPGIKSKGEKAKSKAKAKAKAKAKKKKKNFGKEKAHVGKEAK